MFPVLLHFFSFIFCVAGLGVTLLGTLLTIAPFTTSLICHKFQAAFPFLVMTLCGLLGVVIGWKGITSIPAPNPKPRKVELEIPSDAQMNAEIIREDTRIYLKNL